jgi:hypothetical protein
VPAGCPETREVLIEAVISTDKSNELYSLRYNSPCTVIFEVRLWTDDLCKVEERQGLVLAMTSCIAICQPQPVHYLYSCYCTLYISTRLSPDTRQKIFSNLPALSNMPFRVPATLFRPRALPTISARRTLTTTPRMFLKEDADRSPEQIEKKKQEQLKKQEKGEGEWHESLASSSESHIAADKEHVNDHDDHMSKLQEETKKKGEKGEI